MKKTLLICFPIALIFSFVSCNDRLDGDEITNIDAVKIDSMKIELDTMNIFAIQSIKTYSNYTQNCEGFYGYDYLYTGSFERKVISYKFKTATNCGDEITRVSQINFRPQVAGTYVFKFYTGKDASGENIFIEKNIEVR